MNIAYFLHPKNKVSYLYEDYSFRQGLEKMRRRGYSAMPVISREGHYIGSVSEGDFLWRILDSGSLRISPERDLENLRVRDILRKDRIAPVRITVTREELVLYIMNQNFVPVVDDADRFIGIVTRRDMIRYLAAEQEITWEGAVHAAGYPDRVSARG